MTKYPSQMQDKFNLRFPEGMRDAIADAAKSSGRSMNSEIIYRIQRSFDLDDIERGFPPENQTISINKTRIIAEDESSYVENTQRNVQYKSLNIVDNERLKESIDYINKILGFTATPIKQSEEKSADVKKRK